MNPLGLHGFFGGPIGCFWDPVGCFLGPLELCLGPHGLCLGPLGLCVGPLGFRLGSHGLYTFVVVGHGLHRDSNRKEYVVRTSEAPTTNVSVQQYERRHALYIAITKMNEFQGRSS